MVAVLILGLLATAAALCFGATLRASGARDAIEQIRFVDATARQAAQRFGRGIDIVLDLSAGTLARREAGASGRATYQAALPRGYRIDEVRSARRRFFDGQVTVHCSPLGIIRSYAVRVVGPGLDRWLLVAGLGGDVLFGEEQGDHDAEPLEGTPRDGAPRDNAD
jgi:type II secretory pathway pseudopilin PulG